MNATRIRPRITVPLTALALASATLLVALPGTSNAVTNTCGARNVTRDTAAGANLQRVIKRAHAGDTIQVKNRCVGNFWIDKSLRIIGAPTAAMPTPVLNGNGTGRVLFLRYKTTVVTLTNLKLTGGSTPDYGGGIYSTAGKLTLNDVTVSGNLATGSVSAGGIYVSHQLILNGSSNVSDNASTGNGATGGGIYNSYGVVTLNDSASVSGNAAAGAAGGIQNTGTVILGDNSSVTSNEATADVGGGIWGGTVILKGSASVTGNSASIAGGGLYGNVLVQACGPGVDEWVGAISPNAPDDPPTVTLITCS